MPNRKARRAAQKPNTRMSTPVNSDHMRKLAAIISGFNHHIDKGLIRLDGHHMYIYPEIWVTNPAAFTTNAYRYLRLQHHLPEGTAIEIFHIETSQHLATFSHGTATIH